MRAGSQTILRETLATESMAYPIEAARQGSVRRAAARLNSRRQRSPPETSTASVNEADSSIERWQPSIGLGVSFFVAGAKPDHVTLRFHFDFISPYAYLGWTQIHAIADRHGRAVEPVPILFAALLDHHGTKGPAEIPAKRRHLLFDTVRKARALGVAFGPPPHHPFNPLLALRVASVPMDAFTRRALIDRLYAGVWSGEGANVEDPATIERFVAEVGLDARRVIEDAQSPEGKARVREQTAGAIAGGVFGVPTIVADGEAFWGVDSLPTLDRFLAEGKPTLDRDALARWSSVTPSAERPAAKR
jgi:2-hydroxychromene-2-carboxylate isomerase